MIKFKKLSMKNFLSVGNAPLEYDFQDDKIYLISGSNGSGKSVLLDGICFSLYSKAFRNINMPDLINSINGKNLETVIEFSIGDDEYKVERGMRPNYMKIYINGELKKADAAKFDYQKFLEKNILRMDLSTFRQICILGSANFVPFMQLSAGGRRGVVEDLLDLGIFSVMGRVAKEKLASLVSESKTVDSDIRATKALLEETLGIVNKLKEDGSNVVAQKQEQIEESQSKIDGLNDKLVDLNSKIDELLSGEDFNADLQLAEKEMLKVAEMTSSIHSEIKRIEKDTKFLKDNSTCPSCHQDIDESFREEHLCGNNEKLVELNGYIEKSDKMKQKLSKRINDRKESINLLREYRQDVMIVENEKEAVRRVIDMLNNDILQHSQKENTNVSHYEARLVELNEKIEELKERNHEIMIEGKRYTYIHEMLKDTGIKSKIIETYLPLINHLMKQYLTIMEANMEFTFDEKFNESIKSRYRDSFSYASFSEGEKLRIDLALLFAWREVSRKRNSSATNLLIFDEIGDSSLDVDGFEAFMKILGSEREKQCVIIISHSPEKISGKVNRLYEYEKKHGFTALKNRTDMDTNISLT